MIIHASIPALEPERVARVFAELWRGEYMPFPVFPDSFIAISGAGDGAEIEVTPAALELVPGDVEVVTRPRVDNTEFARVHLAAATPLSEGEVHAIAAREGWMARTCNRGDAFHVIELWIENRLLVEVLTEPMQREYFDFMNPARFRQFIADATTPAATG